MIDWEKLARERGFLIPRTDEEIRDGADTSTIPGDPHAMLIALYEEHKSIGNIASVLNMSWHTVRVAFERFNVEVKTQGGPQRRKFVVTEDILTDCEREGIGSVAKKLELDYSTVYKATREPLRKRRAEREGVSLSSAGHPAEPGTQNHE